MSARRYIRWEQARLANPFVSWEFDGASLYYAAYGNDQSIAWFWYNLPGVTVETHAGRWNREWRVDTMFGEVSLVRDYRSTNRSDPYLVAYAHAVTWDYPGGANSLPLTEWDFNAMASRATLAPPIPKGSRVRVRFWVMNDAEVDWVQRPVLHVQLNPPIPPLDQAGDIDRWIGAVSLQWGNRDVLHWVPGKLALVGHETVGVPRGAGTSLVHEFEVDEELYALGIALEFGVGASYQLSGPDESTGSTPIPWTDVRVTSIEYAPPLPEPVRRVEEAIRDWRSRERVRRQAVQ
ncbi:hypothetical protein OO015_13825 (plasmid) [Thermomicrobium sp. 4228-Ro]|uniref:hypothetical protein n=1 Tax=Thermomicrobium sp. 4228-Ro TaxID=2993937 RepID=UPI002248A286|nr:hypothetical protein [Thermomicrobium sp. 4228-Ro]MCX2728564.1 hypothetical protein [Thermomicrobium sp. 4228-Ro]